MTQLHRNNGTIAVEEATQKAPMFHRQAGVTLIEMMIVLVIIAGIIGLGSSMFSSSLGRSDATQEISNVTNLITSGRTVRTGNGYPSDMHTALMRIDGYPSNMDVDTSGATNLWGGDVTVARSTDQRNFSVTYTGVSEAGCYELVTKVGVSRMITTSIGSNTAEFDALEALASEHCADDVTVGWEISG